MKKVLLQSIAIAAILLTSCSKEVYYGSGDIVSETREMPQVDRLKISGVFEVNIEYGAIQKIEIVADDNIINKIRTRTVDGKLTVDFKNGNYRDVDATLNLTLTNLSAVQYSGSGDIAIFDFYNLESLKLENTGSGSFYLNSGSSAVLNWFNEGSGKLEAKDFMSSEVKIDIKGSGDSYVNCTELLTVSIEGSGNVFYLGEPELNTNILGSGRVVRINE